MAENSILPNSGAAISDVAAVGDDKVLQSSWLATNNIDYHQRIRLKRLSHVRYQHPDLEKLHSFMLDFGMQMAKRTTEEAWYRGYGPDNYVYYARKGPKAFLGGTFEVESLEELQKASKIPGAGDINPMDDAPGGGFLLTIVDPEGFQVNLIYGQQDKRSLSIIDSEELASNYPDSKHRVRKFNRFQPGPAAVHKVCTIPGTSSSGVIKNH